jgi:hypothetical protein
MYQGYRAGILQMVSLCFQLPVLYCTPGDCISRSFSWPATFVSDDIVTSVRRNFQFLFWTMTNLFIVVLLFVSYLTTLSVAQAVDLL